MTLFDRLAETADRLCAKPLAFIAFNLMVAALYLTAGIDIANITVSIITAALVLLELGANRRHAKATQAKLDELVKATPKARDELTHAEDLDEKKIEEMRR